MTDRLATAQTLGRVDNGLPEEGYAAALAGLSGMGPVRLRTMLDRVVPSVVFGEVVDGSSPQDPERKWRTEARAIDVARVHHENTDGDTAIVRRGSAAYPGRLAHDVEGPAVVFARGARETCDLRPTVCLIGTRRASRYGLGVAAQLGAELASIGVAVVSGLAPGIDGAAHEGAWGGWRAGGSRAGPPIGVVAGPLDAPSPARPGSLWARVGTSGVLFSEAPVGAGRQRWWLPARNRILAALSDVVVVVECHAHGNALQTVSAAEKRAIPIGAVPGSIRSPSSVGTNSLLADGCFPVRDVTDVLVALELAGAGVPWKEPADPDLGTDPTSAAGSKASR